MIWRGFAKGSSNPDPHSDAKGFKIQTDPLAADMAWYEENSGKLFKRYPNQYIAIDGGKVIDHDEDFGSLAERVFKKVGARPILMPLCQQGRRIARVPSPRVVA